MRVGIHRQTARDLINRFIFFQNEEGRLTRKVTHIKSLPTKRRKKRWKNKKKMEE
jgi:hypothetical protein